MQPEEDTIRQYVFCTDASVGGFALSVLLYGSIVLGVWKLTLLLSLALVIGVYAFLWYRYERNPDTGKRRPIYCRGQSPSFMAGPFLVLPASTITSYAYGHHAVTYPAWASYWWQWMLLGLATWVGFGYVFRLVDNKRYVDAIAAPMLDSPTCWWIRVWQMPTGAGVMVATVVPLWLTGGIYATWTEGFVGLWVVIAAMEIPFPPNPFEQHEMWNKKAFRAMIREEIEAYAEAQKGQ